MINKKVYQTFIDSVALHYKQHPSAMGQKMSELLSSVEISYVKSIDTDKSISSDTFTIDSHIHLQNIIEKNSHPLLASLNNCYQSLSWRPSGFGKLPAEITNHVAVVEIIGPTGMIEDKRFRFGILLQDPQILYAKHQHEAEELYLVLSGVASWAVDEKIATDRNAGEFIHHAKNQPHQMKTNDEPLLAIWAWLGDISADSYSI